MRDVEKWNMVFYRESTGSIVQTVDICVDTPRGFILLSCAPVIEWEGEPA